MHQISHWYWGQGWSSLLSLHTGTSQGKGLIRLDCAIQYGTFSLREVEQRRLPGHRPPHTDTCFVSNTTLTMQISLGVPGMDHRDSVWNPTAADFPREDHGQDKHVTTLLFPRKEIILPTSVSWYQYSTSREHRTPHPVPGMYQCTEFVRPSPPPSALIARTQMQDEPPAVHLQSSCSNHHAILPPLKMKTWRLRESQSWPQAPHTCTPASPPQTAVTTSFGP